MKTRLLHVFLLCFTFTIYSQQNVWTGAIDDKWSNEENWSGDVPTPSDDVLIPSGFVVTVDTPADILSIEVQGNSVLNVTSAIAIQNPSEFEDNVVVNWSSGDLIGPGILLNSGTINMAFPSFDLSGSTVLNNPGTINMVGGNIGIGVNSVLNNSGTGIIDFKTDNGMFGATSGDVINFGTIKTSFTDPSHEAFMACDIINQDGIFQIDTGTLSLNNTVVNSMGGEFNVASGATLNLNSPMTISGILSGLVFGDLNWNVDFIVPTTAFLNFSGNGIINCTGDLDGGGTLTNQTTINQIGSSLQIDGTTTLNNEGLLDINGSGLTIFANSIINNNASGIIDIKVSGVNINSSGALNNSGLIRAPFSNTTDQSVFSAQFNNNNGVIQVDNGTLFLINSNNTLNNGTYNIASDGKLQWTLPITISGELNGNLDGVLGWGGDLIVPTTASFNFTGSGSVDWNTRFLTGGGILTNEHVISTLSGSNKIIDGATTLVNNGEIKSGGFVRIDTNSTLNNTAQGVINIESSGSSFGTVNSSPHTFINSGSIIASHVSGFVSMSAPLNNFGVIEATTAEIDFSNTLVNETTGVIRGNGIIDLPSSGNFTNNGAFAPGNSPGSLNVLGDYVSAPTSILNIELNGLTQETEYDLLAISGNADFEGNIQVTLGFEANVNDEFIVATTTNSINTCNFPATVNSSFGGSTYEFDVTCRNNDELVLTITAETLGIETFEENTSVQLYPNPASDIIYLSDKDIQRIEVYDLNGKTLKKSTSNSISIQKLSKGIYIIKAVSKNSTTIIKRFIKI